MYVSMSVSVWMAIEIDNHGLMKCKRLTGDEHDGLIRRPLSMVHSDLLRSNMIVAKEAHVRALLADWRCDAVMMRGGATMTPCSARTASGSPASMVTASPRERPRYSRGGGEAA